MNMAAETPMADHVAHFWNLLETEHVRILVDLRRENSGGVYWDGTSFSDSVAKALVSDYATDAWRPIDTLRYDDIDVRTVLWNPCDGAHLVNVAAAREMEVKKIKDSKMFTHWRNLDGPTTSAAK
jgi:hypothetical protein